MNCFIRNDCYSAVYALVIYPPKTDEHDWQKHEKDVIKFVHTKTSATNIGITDLKPCKDSLKLSETTLLKSLVITDSGSGPVGKRDYTLTLKPTTELIKDIYEELGGDTGTFGIIHYTFTIDKIENTCHLYIMAHTASDGTSTYPISWGGVNYAESEGEENNTSFDDDEEGFKTSYISRSQVNDLVVCIPQKYVRRASPGPILGSRPGDSLLSWSYDTTFIDDKGNTVPSSGAHAGYVEYAPPVLGDPILYIGSAHEPWYLVAPRLCGGYKLVSNGIGHALRTDDYDYGSGDYCTVGVIPETIIKNPGEEPHTVDADRNFIRLAQKNWCPDKYIDYLTEVRNDVKFHAIVGPTPQWSASGRYPMQRTVHQIAAPKISYKCQSPYGKGKHKGKYVESGFTINAVGVGLNGKLEKNTGNYSYRYNNTTTTTEYATTVDTIEFDVSFPENIQCPYRDNNGYAYISAISVPTPDGTRAADYVETVTESSDEYVNLAHPQSNNDTYSKSMTVTGKESSYDEAKIIDDKIAKPTRKSGYGTCFVRLGQLASDRYETAYKLGKMPSVCTVSVCANGATAYVKSASGSTDKRGEDLSIEGLTTTSVSAVNAHGVTKTENQYSESGSDNIEIKNVLDPAADPVDFNSWYCLDARDINDLVVRKQSGYYVYCSQTRYNSEGRYVGTTYTVEKAFKGIATVVSATTKRQKKELDSSSNKLVTSVWQDPSPMDPLEASITYNYKHTHSERISGDKTEYETSTQIDVDIVGYKLITGNTIAVSDGVLWHDVPTRDKYQDEFRTTTIYGSTTGASGELIPTETRTTELIAKGVSIYKFTRSGSGTLHVTHAGLADAEPVVTGSGKGCIKFSSEGFGSLTEDTKDWKHELIAYKSENKKNDPVLVGGTMFHRPKWDSMETELDEIKSTFDFDRENFRKAQTNAMNTLSEFALSPDPGIVNDTKWDVVTVNGYVYPNEYGTSSTDRATMTISSITNSIKLTIDGYKLLS